MKAVIQRVSHASVTIEGRVHATIDKGYLVLLGVHKDDTEADALWIAKKIAGLRIFEDENQKMNADLASANGEVLLISQFTLIASNKKGNRPSFNDAAPPDLGRRLYQRSADELSALTSKPVKTGSFGADMKVQLLNDGPVTILFDTRNKE